ncbi:hypothetical protein QTO12_03235 [Vibrio owensii]|uniref:hypothetical protein n=1 Tax=Vibrio owensii TaxID=696485 RepID=UPI002F3F32F7
MKNSDKWRGFYKSLSIADRRKHFFSVYEDNEGEHVLTLGKKLPDIARELAKESGFPVTILFVSWTYEDSSGPVSVDGSHGGDLVTYTDRYRVLVTNELEIKFKIYTGEIEVFKGWDL